MLAHGMEGERTQDEGGREKKSFSSARMPLYVEGLQHGALPVLLGVADRALASLATTQSNAEPSSFISSLAYTAFTESSMMRTCSQTSMLSGSACTFETSHGTSLGLIQHGPARHPTPCHHHHQHKKRHPSWVPS